MCSLVSLLAAVTMLGQEAPGAGTSVADQEIVERVAIIGASVSAGFGIVVEIEEEDSGDHSKTMIAMKDVLMVADGDADPAYLDLSSHLFFSRPREFAESAIDRTLSWKPDLVLAIDFLFWFAYGYLPEDQRLASLELGLDMLDKLAATGIPLVIGELPDLEGIESFVIRPGQIPTRETVLSGNLMIEQWASERENVAVVPIGTLSDQLRSTGELTVGRYRWNQDPGDPRLISADKLHPTFDGLVCLMQAMEVSARSIRSTGRKLPPLELDIDALMRRMKARRLGPRRAGTGIQYLPRRARSWSRSSRVRARSSADSTAGRAAREPRTRIR